MNQSVIECDPRSELSAAWQSLGEALPAMRMGQVMAAVGEVCADLHGRGLWDATDSELLEAAWQFRQNLDATTGAPDATADGDAVKTLRC